MIAKCIEKFAPTKLAEAWDNTGVLVDCNTKFIVSNTVLLTIDLTEEVLDECISKAINLVVCYHPVIFDPIRQITDTLIIKCIQNNISVYSPHTQLDPLMNRFILDSLGDNPGTLQDVVNSLKNLSRIGNFRVVKGSYRSGTPRVYTNNGDIRAGVGATFRSVDAKDCLLITGEMPHHALLKAKRNGVDVVMMEHSNSERIFLKELKRLMENDEELVDYRIVISEKDVDPVEFI